MRKNKTAAIMMSLTAAAGMLSTTAFGAEITKNDPEITITIAKQLDENAGRYADGDDINNNPMTRLAQEKLGIKFDCILLGGDASNYNTKLRLSLTGSDQLPDVFSAYDTQIINDMIDSGRVKAIDEDIENYLSDRLKALYEQYPQTFYPVTRDGKTYGIAISPCMDIEQVMIIRQDWLDKLGLKAPTTIEEFETVIKAFTEDDPDGNGQKDTYGFAYSGNDIYNTGWTGDPVTIFSAFSGKYIPGSWQEDEDGKLVYSSLNEGNKEALATMAKWHANGWIFQEAAATGAWDAMTQFTEGKAGIFVGRSWCVGSVDDVKSVDPNAVIKAYPNILQQNGEHGYQSGQVNDGYLMFNADFKYMEQFFQYLDWLYDVPFGTGENVYGYIQDQDFDILDDGTVVFDSKFFDPAFEDGFMPGKSTVMKNTPRVESEWKAYYDVVNGKEPESAYEIKAAAMVKSNAAMAEAYAVAYEHRDELETNLFNGAPTKTMQRSWEQLQTMEKQCYTNIIYGNADISSFDEFVEKWKANGGDKITEEVNEWYQSVK